MDHLLSFIPYVLSFLIIYSIAGVLLLKKRYLKEYDDLWEKEKTEILGPAFRVALTLCIVVCVCRCLYDGHLTLADRIFVLLWAIWSIFARRDLKELKK